MQGVRRVFHRIGESNLLLGVVSLILVAIIGVVTSVFYLVPRGQQTVTFTTRDASAVSAGDDVRVAGISVGKVKDITLQKKNVRVELEVKDDVRIGNKSTIDVRLLTAVGGYFVTIIPGGQVTGDSTTIPGGRVTVPYTIADTLQQLPRVTDDVKGEPIDAVLQQLSTGFAGNSGAVRSMVAGMNSVAQTMDQQRSQVDSIMSMANNYLTTFNNSRDFLFTLIRKVNTALSRYYTYRAGFSEAYHHLGEVLRRLGNVAQFYLNHSHEIYPAVLSVRATVEKMRDGMDQMIKNLGPLHDQLNRLLPEATSDRKAFEVGAICIPVHGRTC